MKKIRDKFREETLDKKGIFLPFSFTTLLNFLSLKANRLKLLDEIKENVQISVIS